MKRLLQILKVLILLLMVPSYLFAYDFELDGIAYNKLSGSANEVEVTTNKNKYGSNIYSGDISIPSEVVYSGITYKVTAIGDGAFSGCGHNIKSVKMPTSIIRIGNNAFKSLWDISTVDIPNSVTSIGDNAFNDCQSLVSIKIPNNVISIGKECFDYCLELRTVSLGSSLEIIGSNAFSRCAKLNSIYFGNSVESIGGGAFAECICLTTIDIPNSVKEIGASAFTECTNLKNVSLSHSISKIDNQLFYNCKNLESIDIPNSVKSIGNSAFSGCNNLITIQNSSALQSIGKLAFQDCYYLSSITFPNTLQSIGSQAFYNCPSLSLVISEMTDPFQIDNQFFYIQPGLGIPTQSKTLQIPGGTKQKYIDKGWTGHFNYVIEDIKIYKLVINSLGKGTTTYGTNLIRESSQEYEIEDGSSMTLTLNPDNGYRIKSIMVNSTDVTSSVSNNQYTVSNIKANTTVEVEFEAIPIPTYILSVKATGNGSATYDGTTAKNNTKTFTLNEGTSATITFSSDNGYRIKTVKVNSSDVTSSVSNNQYTVSNIKANTTLEVEFEAIPITTYTLSVKAMGNGSATYYGTTAKNNTKTFTLNEGTSATITFSPDNGYRIKTVKVNNTDVTSSVSNNQYTVSNIKANTTLEVEFEAIPITTYTLSIKATGNGSATYDGTTAKNNTKTFTLNEATSATITFTPDNGYRIKSVKLNSTDVTSKVLNNSYTISSISANTTLEVEFEAIPITTYKLSIKATGNGSASYDGTTAKNNTKTFTLNEETSATITFTPDNGYRIKSVKVNSVDVTSSVSNNSYTVSNIKANTTVEVEFEAIPIPTYTLSVKATGNGSATYNGTTAKNNTQTFTLNEGTSANIMLAPDNGYRIKSVKVNGVDVTSSVSNNSYTVSNIRANTTLEVEFEAIPINSYTLKYVVDGVTYQTYQIQEGATITPEAMPTKEGYTFSGWSEIPQIMPSMDVTVTGSFIVNKYKLKYQVDGVEYKSYDVEYGATITPEAYPTKDGYTFSGWSEIPKTMPAKDVTVVGTFTKDEPIIKTYTLTITASGNGSATFNNTTSKNDSKTFTQNEGTSATIAFTPDNGYRIKSVKVNSVDVTSGVSNNSYTVSNIKANTTVEVEFEAIPINSYTLKYVVDGVTYQTYQIQEGATITPEAEPTKEGYTFSGWSEIPKTMPNHDITITGTFTKNEPVVKTYILTITATSNGSATYDGTIAKNNTQSFTLNAGSNATITFTPDNDYRIKSVKVNSTDVTSSVSNNQYTISNISANTTVEVEFEAIPILTKFEVNGIFYKISENNTVGVTNGNIKYSGDIIIPSLVTYNNTTYSVTYIDEDAFNDCFDLTSVTIAPSVRTIGIDAFNGCHSLTSIIIPNGVECISWKAFWNCSGLTSVTIPPSLNYIGDNAFKGCDNLTAVYISDLEAYLKIEFDTNEGEPYCNPLYYAHHLFLNGEEIKDLVIPNTITGIRAFAFNGCSDLISVSIPNSVTYFGYLAFGNCSSLNKIVSEIETPKDIYSVFSDDIYTNAELIVPKGRKAIYQATEGWNRFTNIVEIGETEPVNPGQIHIGGVNYQVTESGGAEVVSADNGVTSVTVPSSLSYNNSNYKVSAIAKDAFENCEHLAAVIWEPEAPFNAKVNNPNLLLYVSDEQYASWTVKNVVVNGTAESIELTDAASGNDFYCPKAFTAKKISYSHYYNMETGLGDSKGWETIVLPFDVQKYTSPKGENVPFSRWQGTGSIKPFWLFELTANGYKEVDDIKANTPYIISMPNNPQYLADYVITGIVTFTAENVEVQASDGMQSALYRDRTFVPNYINQSNDDYFALNVDNYYVTNSSTDKYGSKFIKGLRSVRPFEAYMTSTSNTRSIDVMEGMTTAIKEIMMTSEGTDTIKVYDTKGVLVKTTKHHDDLRKGLAAGVYIVNGKKMIIK